MNCLRLLYDLALYYQTLPCRVRLRMVVLTCLCLLLMCALIVIMGYTMGALPQAVR